MDLGFSWSCLVSPAGEKENYKQHVHPPSHPGYTEAQPPDFEPRTFLLEEKRAQQHSFDQQGPEAGRIKEFVISAEEDWPGLRIPPPQEDQTAAERGFPL